MWFASARKTPRTPLARASRQSFRPRFEALENRCLMSAGALDATFGNSGLVTGGPAAYSATATVVQADGKIVAVGSAGIKLSRNKSDDAFALARRR